MKREINSLKVLFDRQVVYLLVAAALLLMSVVPAIATSAAQLTERSIALSSSSKNVDDVTYEVTFTAPSAAGALVIDFCAESPMIGETCTGPVGMDANGATTGTSGYTIDDSGAADDANTVVLTSTIDADETVTVALANIDNPTNAGTIYARILTYATSGAAGAYTSGSPGSFVDEGGAAIAITDSVGVSGAVLESMTFCVSKNTIDENCGGTLVAPTLQLGEDVGGVIALNPNDVHEGGIYTQISTNAVSGAIVSLKSDAAECGGLIRAGSEDAEEGCGIGPALAAGIEPGEALFGVKTATATEVGDDANGAFRPYDSGSGAYYNSTDFKLRYVDGDTDGITSTYGDQFLDTNGAPVNNMQMQLTFGASVSNQTPAGTYSAALSLIATGKF
jgi:hypothetical protein